MAGSMIAFVSPSTGAPLWQERDELVSLAGERVPLVRAIPRFVPSDNYADAFGLQWNQHSQTQLDSHTGARLSEERLVRCAGMPLEQFAGLRVLEAGCGAGRFTELLRSEEHTSELQSRGHLVCRLLPEKKTS